jgi:hypothetical protein
MMNVKNEKHRETVRKYYQKHKKEIMMRNHEYYLQHKESANKSARKYYNKNKEKIKAWRKKYYEKHKEEQKIHAKKYYEEHINLIRAHYNKNKEKINKKHQMEYAQLRGQIFELLGNKCNNPSCLVSNGCSDIRCLQIDHISGGGCKEIKSFGSPKRFYIYVLEQLKSGSKNYQLLCANCNWIKRHENKE